jgi:helix-turn-helix protein
MTQVAAMVTKEDQYGVIDAARLTGFSHQTIRRAVSRGHLKAQKISGVVIISRSDLQCWLDEHVNRIVTLASAVEFPERRSLPLWDFPHQPVDRARVRYSLGRCPRQFRQPLSDPGQCQRHALHRAEPAQQLTLPAIVRRIRDTGTDHEPSGRFARLRWRRGSGHSVAPRACGDRAGFLPRDDADGRRRWRQWWRRDRRPVTRTFGDRHQDDATVFNLASGTRQLRPGGHSRSDDMTGNARRRHFRRFRRFGWQLILNPRLLLDP